MRRIFGTVLVGTALVLPVAPSAEAKKLGCHPTGAKTITRSAKARVFKYKGLVYGCLFRRGVAEQMTTNDGYGEDFLSKPTPMLAGHFVGYTYAWEGAGDGGGWSVRAIDLSNGRTHLSDFDGTEKGFPDENVTVHRLILSATGALAWSWTLEYSSGKTVNEIRRLGPKQNDFGLKVKPLDSGPDVDVDSLERRGASIVWLHADEERMARLG
jgi:hypothetical protein